MSVSDNHDQIETAASSQPASLAPTCQRKKKCRWSCLLGLSLLIVLLIGAAWLGQRQHVLKKQLKLQTKNLSHLQASLFETQNDLYINRAELMQAKQILTQMQQQLQGSGREQFDLVQSAYLIQMANYYVEVMHQPKIAAKLLGFSLQNLSHTVGANVFQLRQVLTDNIAKLKAVPDVDLEKISQDLNALNMMLDQLSLKLPAAYDKTNSTASTATQASSTLNWRQHLHAAAKAFAQLIIIRHHNGVVAELLAPDQHAYLMQNLHLLLQQAQWAACNRQQTIYQTSLKQVSNLIRQYFVTQSPLAQSILESLDKLSTVEISPALPDLSNVVLTLQNAQTKQQPPSSTAEASGLQPPAPLKLHTTEASALNQEKSL